MSRKRRVKQAAAAAAAMAETSGGRVGAPGPRRPSTCRSSSGEADRWRVCGGNPAGKVHKVFFKILDKLGPVVEKGPMEDLLPSSELQGFHFCAFCNKLSSLK